jgi:hypothetical protein
VLLLLAQMALSVLQVSTLVRIVGLGYHDI